MNCSFASTYGLCGSCLKQTDIFSVTVADKLISQLTDVTTTSCDGVDRMDNVHMTDLGASLGCSGNTAQKHKHTLGRSREKEGENRSGKNTTGKRKQESTKLTRHWEAWVAVFLKSDRLCKIYCMLSKLLALTKKTHLLLLVSSVSATFSDDFATTACYTM